MPAFTASAPGKIILFGEHAVVYGRPALAVPVQAVQARAIVRADVTARRGAIRLISPAIQLDQELSALSPQHPLRRAVELTAEHLQIRSIPACEILIQSTIPVAGGLGSGAAVSIALIRALAAYLGRPLSTEQVSALAYEVEKIHHGTPSGVDNTVIAFEQAVVYTRGRPIQPIRIQLPFHLLIADTGIPSPTAQTVGDVRAAWQANAPRYEAIFDQIADIVHQAIDCLANPPVAHAVGDSQSSYLQTLGHLMNANHHLLKQLDVSCAELDTLAQTALEAGAYGAKLSGGGRGGNLIVLIAEGQREQVSKALRDACARQIYLTCVSS
jgi:mevalonate kinase